MRRNRQGYVCHRVITYRMLVWTQQQQEDPEADELKKSNHTSSRHDAMHDFFFTTLSFRKWAV